MHSHSDSQKKSLMDKWVTVLGATQSEKIDWLSEYANQQDNMWGDTTVYGSTTGSLSSLQSKEEFPSLLPIAMKVTAKTIGLDLVSVNPIMAGGDPKLLEAAKSKVKATNRERQMDSVLEDKPFEPLKIEDTEEYKEYKKYSGSGPRMDLIYLDYLFKPLNTTNKPKKNHHRKTKKK